MKKFGTQATQGRSYLLNSVSSDKNKQEILILNNKKASREGDVPFNILKGGIDTDLSILNKVLTR